MGHRSPIARRLAPSRVAPAADGSASCGGGTFSFPASVLSETFANSAPVGPVQGRDTGRGSTAPRSSSHKSSCLSSVTSLLRFAQSDEHGAISMIRKFSSQSERKVMSSVYVERAQRMARFIEDDEYRQVGDRDVARQRIARRYGFAARALYSLRYCRPKQIAADLYDALCSAVEDAATRQIKLLEAEIAQARAGRLGLREGVVRSAETALREAVALLDGGAK